jgi:hypothetical protein
MPEKAMGARHATTANNQRPQRTVRPTIVFHRTSQGSDAEGLSRLVSLAQNRGTRQGITFPLQKAMEVSTPLDPAEREAEVKARRVMRMAVSVNHFHCMAPIGVGRKAKTDDEKALRRGDGSPSVEPATESAIRNGMSGGTPLPVTVRSFMEPRFGADLSNVRIHDGAEAARLNAHLNARAFTVGRHVFFARGHYQPESAEGRHLIAHELTHTIQQGAIVQRSTEEPVSTGVAATIQRFGVGDALAYFADRANMIPGFRLLTVVLGFNPLNMSRVPGTTATILRAVIEVIPGGGLVTQALESTGIFERAAAWVDRQIATLGLTVAAIRGAITRFLDSLDWGDIFDLGSIWERAKRFISEPASSILNFVRALVGGIVRLIKEAILRPFARFAARTRGYDLLKAILGRDPITGEPAARSSETIIAGFMKLIGKEEVWENLKRANAVGRAWVWLQGALSSLLGIVSSIPGRIIDAIASLSIQDIVTVEGAFGKIVGVFRGVAGDFGRWGANQVIGLLEILFSVVAPGVVPYIRRAGGAFRTILQNPVSFVRNLVRAGREGLLQFSARFLVHLRAGLVRWFADVLGPGMYIPLSLGPKEVFRFVLSVMGLTWQHVRQKVVRVVGERAVTVVERGVDVVAILVREGPAAAWDRIAESFADLKGVVIDAVMNFASSYIVQAAITRLVGLLNPAGAVLQAIVAIYNTIMLFVERLRQVAQVAASFVGSIASIAAGAIGAAANRVEQALAGAISLTISFLARLTGLGRVADAVRNIVGGIRTRVDRALDRIVQWIVEIARRIGSRAVGASGRTRAQDLNVERNV